jgi:multiple sugar transport system ATP-binding protein
VYENIRFPLRVRKVPKETHHDRVMKAAGMVELLDFLDRRPAALSGGQRQRVALARAIVREPNAFLMDEPLSNLDAKLRVAMRSEIKELHQRLKTTSVYVTHDQIEAMTMGDRIVVMKDGRIEQVGSPLELYDHPANVFVAGFIGSPAMNFVPATLKKSGGAAQLVLDDGTQLPAPPACGGSDGQTVVLGTRPEHLRLASEGGIASRVVVMEPTGADTFVACRHGSTEVAAVFRERHEFAPGSTIHLMPDLARAHLFDAASGERLAA